MLKAALRFICTVVILGDMLEATVAADRKPHADEDSPLLKLNESNSTLNDGPGVLILDKNSENFKNRVNALHDDLVKYQNSSFEDKEESRKAKRQLKDKCKELRGILLQDRLLEKRLQIEPATSDTLQNMREDLGQTTFLDAPFHNTRKFVSGIMGSTHQTS